jgi:hypothetical protein
MKQLDRKKGVTQSSMKKNARSEEVPILNAYTGRTVSFFASEIRPLRSSVLAFLAVTIMRRRGVERGIRRKSSAETIVARASSALTTWLSCIGHYGFSETELFVSDDFFLRLSSLLAGYHMMANRPRKIDPTKAMMTPSVPAASPGPIYAWAVP